MIEANTTDLACQSTKEKQSTLTKEQPNFNPKAFTTHKKHNKKSKAKIDYSIAKSMLFSIDETLGLNSLFEGEMVHYSFDCPKNLREAFNREIKQNGHSGCKIQVQNMANYVFASMVKKNALGNTISRLADTKISVAEMNFTQNVQNRPRRLVSQNNRAVVQTVGSSDYCQIGGGQCLEPAIETMVYQQKDYRVCAKHASAYAGSKGWSCKK